VTAMDHSNRDHSSRGTFLKGAAAASIGAVLAGASTTLAPDASAVGPHPDTVSSILATLLLTERLATTFYYTALTSPGVMRNSRLGGSSTNALDPGLPPNGNPSYVRCLQAALDAESQHAGMLAQAGATSPHTQFYFPRATFTQMGTSTDAQTFLGVLDHLETVAVGAYIAAVHALASPRHVELASLTARIAGVEAEHRMLGRLLAGLKPANNLTLERMPFAQVSDAAPVLQPFLTGRGFAQGAIGPLALPTPAQTTHLVGKYGTLLVRRFL
jgi:Ferritin-like domain